MLLQKKIITVKNTKIETVKQWPISVDQIKSFLELYTYNEQFVLGITDIEPENELKLIVSGIVWTTQLTLRIPSSLGYHGTGERFILETDASNTGIWVIPSQLQLEQNEWLYTDRYQLLTEIYHEWLITQNFKELLKQIEGRMKRDR